jgi:tetratricopeptide (TPR) repeat protein
VYLARAELRLKQSRFDAALEDAQRAIDVATAARGAARHSNFLGLALLMRADIERQMDDRKAALRSLRLAVENLRGTVDAQHPDARRAQQLLQELSMA